MLWEFEESDFDFWVRLSERTGVENLPIFVDSGIPLLSSPTDSRIQSTT